jgi:hypothetical protein
MQGVGGCGLFKFFEFNGRFFGHSGALRFASFHSGRAGQNPNPSQTEGFGTPHGLGELRLEVVVWNYPPCRQVNRKKNRD